MKQLLGVPPWLVASGGFVLLVVSISCQSIDLEESQTWSYARLPSIAEVWETLRSDPNVEAQRPLSLLTAYGWARIFGTSEWALRSINLLWMAIALVGMTLVARQIHLPWLPLLFVIQPFVWYSMDLARTPIMQMAGGALLLAGTIKLLHKSSHWLEIAILLSAGFLVLTGSNMFGVVPMIVVLMFLLGTSAWKRLLVSRGSKIFLFSTAGLLALLGGYYLSTVIRGVGGVKLWTVTPFNLLVVAYEFLGYTGLGPGRQELRDILRGTAPAAVLWMHLPGWIGLTVAYLIVLFAAAKSWLTRGECSPQTPSVRLWVLCILVPALSAFLLYCVATATGIPFWGRHLAGTLPFAVTALAVVLHWATQGLWRRAGRFGFCLVIVLLMLSAILIRIQPRQRHDDYRSAAAAAAEIASNGGVVWWVADQTPGEYYGISFVENGPGIISAPNRGEVPGVPPNAIVISRPENFDNQGTAGQLIHSGSYEKSATFQAFEIWTR